MKEVIDRLRRVEDRLERLLASGWRIAAAEAADLTDEADALAELGLLDLANRLRMVGRANGESEALPRIALALTAIRLIRARLPADDPPPGSWGPLVDRTTRRAASFDRLVPLGRLALGDEEVWACARIRGVVAFEIVLLYPVWMEPRSREHVASSSGGFQPSLAQDDPDAAAKSGRPATVSMPSVPWLYKHLRGHLRWQARYPLGANGEAQLFTLTDAEWRLPEGQVDLFAPFREALDRGKLKDGQRVLAAGELRAMKLDPAQAESCVWPDPAVSAAFRAAAQERVWTLAWARSDQIVPLAILIPGDASRGARLVHLVPGNPTVALDGRAALRP